MLHRIGFLTVLCALLLSVGFITIGAAAPGPMMLPQTDAGDQDITGWLFSEKLDGVRGYWDGRQLWSKNGTLFHPPTEFIAGLPDFPLEGELWGGRGAFEKTVSTVLRQQAHGGWLELKFAVFDVPAAAGGFTDRIEKARTWFAAHPSPWAFVIPQHPVRDRAHLRQELRRVEARGGEGLIVRAPDALYAAGRSAQILKVKTFHDAEAVVVEHLPGSGRNRGRLGALLVELPGGMRFRIGTGFSDAERENPPPRGAVITFRYHGFHSSGIPRFPSFLRTRVDQDL